MNLLPEDQGFPQEQRKSFSFSRFTPRRGTWALAATATAALTVIVIAVLVFQPFAGVQPAFAQDDFTLAPESAGAMGVAPDSAFLLTAREPVQAEDVRARLAVRGADEPLVTQVDAHRVRIAFADPLPERAVVAFQLAAETRPYAWAFQTAEPLRVVSTLPGPQAVRVPVNTGIEVALNTDVVSLDAFQAAFSIEPAVAGRFEQHRRTFVFVPNRPLEAATAYTVTISGRLSADAAPGEGEDYAFAFETAATETGRGESGFSLSLPSPFFPPDQAPFVNVYLYSGASGADRAMDVRVRQFPNADTYLAALDGYERTSWRQYVDLDAVSGTAALPVVATFQAPVQSTGRYGSAVAFPDPLPRGYYVADFALEGRPTDTPGAPDTRRAYFQVTEVAAYAVVAVNETLVWVNDTETGGPLAGAEIAVLGAGGEAHTDASGVARVVPDGEGATRLRVRAKGQDVFLPVAPLEPEPSDSRWTYFYTDRPMYQPTDTVQFFGFAEARADGSRPQRVQASFGSYERPFERATADVGADGVFHGTMDIRQVPPGYYALTFTDADTGTQIGGHGVSVSEYVKPAYFLTLTPDTLAAFDGDRVGFAVRGEFFDGTPMKGLQVRVGANRTEQQTVTLDGNGHGRSELTVTGGSSWGPDVLWLTAEPARPEEGEIRATAGIYVFGPDVSLRVREERAAAGGEDRYVVTARTVRPAPTWNAEEASSGPRAGLAVRMQVTEYTYDRVETGTYYDFVNKRTVPQYRYDRRERDLGETVLVTGADGTVSFPAPPTRPDANYALTFSAVDGRGRTATAQTEARRFPLVFDEQPGLFFFNPDAPESDRWNNTHAYAPGSPVRLEVRERGDGAEAVGAARYLYFRAAEGIRHTEVTDQAAHAFVFGEADVPNVHVFGARFDGRGYFPIDQGGNEWRWGAGFSSGYVVTTDLSSRALTVETEAARASYRPGETVELAVRVRDAQGRPVAATVNLNVVDEAYYALVEDAADPLPALYARVPSGVRQTFISHDARLAGLSAAEGGGGGDRDMGSPRKDFEDTAAFRTVRTAADGTARVSFTLPDNITTWRVTAHALDAAGKRAGISRTPVVASMPFFVTPVIREKYLPQDAPVILVRAGGTAVGTSDAVTYRIRVPGEDVERTASAAAGETLRVPLPPLPKGTHEIIIEGRSGAHVDAVSRQVAIVDSWFTRPTVARVSLGSGPTALTGAADGVTHVTFVDGGRGQYLTDLYGLAMGAGDRADQLAAASAATRILNEVFGEEVPEPEPSFEAYQPWGTGLLLLPYGSPDPELTARVALLGDTPFDEAGMARYLQEAVDDASSPREAAQALAGLASLGEPALLDLQRLLADPRADDDTRLSAALGLYLAGDEEGARAVYRSFAERLRRQEGVAYLPAGGQDQAERTAALAVLAAGLGEPDARELYAFLRRGIHTDAWLGIEQIAALRALIARAPVENATVAYTLNGERQTVELAGGARTLAVRAFELADLDPRVVEGTADAVLRHERPAVAGEPSDPALRVSRTYSVDGVATTTFREGDVVKVSLSYEAPRQNVTHWTSYRLVDVLPSGLAPITSAGGYGMRRESCTWHPYDVQGQRVSFFVGPALYAGCTSIDYYARVVTPGTYAAEPVSLVSVTDPNRFGYSQEQVVVRIEE